MNGKILKIANNDLYGNSTDRTVSVFAAFNHLKYMNKYVIFAYTDELDKKILHYGSVHLKSNSLVIFEVNKEAEPFINEFIESYLNNKLDLKEYEIIDISNLNKVEIVSSNERDYDHVKELDQISIKHEKIETINNNEKRNGFLYVLLFVMIALLIGVTYLYFNPSVLETTYKELKCENSLYNNKIDMPYEKTLDIIFDKKDRPIKLMATETYKFSSNTDYDNFKNADKQNEYFTTGEYKYDDDSRELKVFYNEETIIDNYSELYKYLKHEGYTCQEGIYNE